MDKTKAIKATLHSGEVVIPKSIVSQVKNQSSGSPAKAISFIKKAKTVDQETKTSFKGGSTQQLPPPATMSAGDSSRNNNGQSEAERQRQQEGSGNAGTRTYTNNSTGEQMTETRTAHYGKKERFDWGDLNPLNLFRGKNTTTTTRNAAGEVVAQRTDSPESRRAAQEQQAYMERYNQLQDSGQMRSVPDAPVTADESAWFSQQRGAAYNPELGIGIDNAGNYYRGDGTNKTMIGRKMQSTPGGAAPQEGDQTRREEHLNRDSENPNIERRADDPRGQNPSQSAPAPETPRSTETAPVQEGNVDTSKDNEVVNQEDVIKEDESRREDPTKGHIRDADLERRALQQDIFNSRAKRRNIITNKQGGFLQGGSGGTEVQTINSEYDNADFQSAKDRDTDRQLETEKRRYKEITRDQGQDQAALALENMKRQYNELERTRGIDQAALSLVQDKQRYNELTKQANLDAAAQQIRQIYATADAQMKIKLDQANLALRYIRDPNLTNQEKMMMVSAIGAVVPGFLDVAAFGAGQALQGN